MEFRIQTKAEYDAAMKAILELMNKGEENLTTSERSAIFRMAVAVERYEDLLLRPEDFRADFLKMYN
ncbi:MAG: hypothetical protein ACTHMC_04470 [Pseudobacter sp.]|uniref:hypothetical protein n=1 Tax=Pseudobacter sp. TaxID=2045420 RepID=UPI003F7D797B